MSNVFDYLQWRGDLPVCADGFSEVDNLILSRMSYFRFDGIIPENGSTVLLSDACKECLLRKDSFRLPDDRFLADALVSSVRFGEMTLSHYISHTDLSQEKQFAALTADFRGGRFAAFRGTDNTLVGWKEDFNMSFAKEIPSQKEAREYLEMVSAENLYVGGHSKGGNLAVYASAFCGQSTRDRIVSVFNNDGPGFNEEETARCVSERVGTRLHTFVPQSSVVGMLFLHPENFSVVHSSKMGIHQHDLYSWEIMGNHFVCLSERNRGSVFVDETLSSWISAMSPEQREMLADAIYELSETTGAETFQELRKGKNVVMLLKAYKNADGKTKTAIREASELLFSFLKENAPEYLRPHQETEEEK